LSFVSWIFFILEYRVARIKYEKALQNVILKIRQIALHTWGKLLLLHFAFGKSNRTYFEGKLTIDYLSGRQNFSYSTIRNVHKLMSTL